VAPMSIENVGRMAVIADPQGAMFAIFNSPKH
jgi:predicted enzyme related to lactoylglutathione lyase